MRDHPRLTPLHAVTVDVSTTLYQLATAPRDVWHGVILFFRSRADLREENERLRQENLVVSGQAQQLAAVLAENARYRALLNSAEALNQAVVVARVVAITPDPARHLLVLDKGEEDGAGVGKPLLDAKGLMGQIVQAGARSSRALLITDASHALPVQVNRNGVRGVAEGTGELDRMIIRHIAATTDIQVGDLLVSSGLGGRFPPGYPVARVSAVSLSPGADFVAISAAPLADLDRGRHVLIAVDHSSVSIPRP